MSNYIKDYWESNAKKFNTSHWASWGDNWAIDLEIKTIAEYLKTRDKVLDVGCANGYSTYKQASLKKINITGVDYSSNMIDSANEFQKDFPANEKIEFKVADILKLPFSDNVFDVTYTTRVIINLPTWTQQKEAINECIRVTKKGGKVVLSEAFWEPLMLLNALRSLKKMPPLEEHDFNRYLKKSKVSDFLTSQQLNYEIVDFSSLYYLGSRFIRELVTDSNNYEGYSNPINKKFYDLELEFSGGGFGIQQAIILTK